MRVWVLTKEINQYYQEGEYFIDIFPSKPNHSQLTNCGVSQDRLCHTLNGGGRVGDEGEWFYLKDITLDICTIN